MTKPLHCFVVPAYGESPHLRQCLKSLRGQQLGSPIVVASSTATDNVARICGQLDVPLVRHSPNRGIAHDWNVALDSVDAEWVTIAHQDDVYLPSFTARTLEAIRRQTDAVLVFTGYRELLGGRVRGVTPPLRIKQGLIELALLGRESISTRFARTNLLRFGCPIPCPSVTIRKGALPPTMRFDAGFRVNLDWDFWLRVATEVDGSFVCVRDVLMHHRIHPASETTAGIIDGIRGREDRALFGRLWPSPIADLIARAYARSYRYNQG